MSHSNHGLSSYEGSTVSPAANFVGRDRELPLAFDDRGPEGERTASIPLTAANLKAKSVAADSSSEHRLAQAAQELGFTLPLRDLNAEYRSDGGPVERWFRDDGCYSRTVIASYISKNTGR